MKLIAVCQGEIAASRRRVLVRLIRAFLGRLVSCEGYQEEGEVQNLIPSLGVSHHLPSIDDTEP